MFADLHIHSVYSDGNRTVSEIAIAAGQNGISCISITDHDCVDAFNGDSVNELSKKHKLQIIPGIELSAAYKGIDLHILAYFFDPACPFLRQKLDESKKYRRQRLLKMAENMKMFDISLDIDEFNGSLSSGTVSRLHLAQYLLSKKHISDIKIAFDRFIGKNSPAYIPSNKSGIEELIGVIKRSGGIACIAHPHKYALDLPVIQELQRLGVEGIEIMYPGLSASQLQQYRSIADTLGLVSCGGSDCHGTGKGEAAIGSIRVPLDWVDVLRKKAFMSHKARNQDLRKHAA